MAKIRNINKRFIQIQAQHFLMQMGYFYEASRSNQQKAKQLFQSLPFLFFDQNIQSQLYDAIHKNSIECHLDQQEAFKKLCYSIYVEFSNKLDLPTKTYEEFYVYIEDKCYEEEVQYKYWKYNNLHTYLLFLFMITMLVFYYVVKTKDN